MKKPGRVRKSCRKRYIRGSIDSCSSSGHALVIVFEHRFFHEEHRRSASIFGHGKAMEKPA
jgi:hypothetical protein